MEETKLDYGNVSNAVKVGDTVRRDTGLWTPTIHALLNYLHDHTFDYVPKVLGVDDKGREILSYLDGEAAARPWPAVLFTVNGVSQAAKLLRNYHDIVANFRPPADAEWRMGKIEVEPGQIIRHGDLGPWNTIWQGNTLTGLIDWDFAQPGERIEDLAQLAYYFIPLRGEDGWKNVGFQERPDFSARLQVLVESYGMYTSNEVVEALLKHQEEDRERTQDKGEQGIEPWVRFLKRGDVEESMQDSKWLNVIKSELLA